MKPKIKRCICGHWKDEHIRVEYSQYKTTRKTEAVIDKTKKPKIYLECSLCGCENFKESNA